MEGPGGFVKEGAHELRPAGGGKCSSEDTRLLTGGERTAHRSSCCIGHSQPVSGPDGKRNSKDMRHHCIMTVRGSLEIM